MKIIEVGQIVNTHGVRGELKINSWVDDLSEFEEFDSYYYKKDDDYLKLSPDNVRFHKNCAIIKFAEIKDMNEAESFKGMILYAERNENLPDGVFYIEDLIGLAVMSDGKEIGKVCDVFKTGANDVYSVKTEDDKMVYIPAVKEFIREINLNKGIIEINLVDGLL